jgi:hypothetical protein
MSTGDVDPNYAGGGVALSAQQTQDSCCDLFAPSRTAGELTSGAKATHDQILEWLNLQDAQFGRLAGANDTGAGGNGTAAAAGGDHVHHATTASYAALHRHVS